MKKRIVVRETQNLILTLEIKLNHKYTSYTSIANYLKKNSN